MRKTNDTRDRITLSKDNSTLFRIPKRQKIQEAEHQDLRKFCVVPYRAGKDRRITQATFRVFITLCGYANKAGVVWVSQKRLGLDCGVSQPIINRHLKRLRDWGYIERVSYGKKGLKADITRIVYDPSINAEDAIAISNEPISIEDAMAKQKIMIINSIKNEIQTQKGQKEDVLVENSNDPIERLKALYDAEGLPMPTGERLQTELALMQRLS